MAKRDGERAPYRRWRVDIFGHRKTGGMSLQAYGLMQYAGAQNILGVLQMSPRAIAGKCGAMQVRHVTSAISELTSPSRAGEDGRPIAIWWPEIETLWIVETLDEQSDGGSMDASAAKLLTTLPFVVQEAIVARYGDRVRGRVSNTPPATQADTRSTGCSPQETVSRNQESGFSPVVPAGDDSVGPPLFSLETEAEAEVRDRPPAIVAHVLAEMAKAVKVLDAKNLGPRDTPKHRKMIAATTREHAMGPEHWTLAISRQLANVRPNKANWHYLSLSTLCRPNNGVMARLLDAPNGGVVAPGGRIEPGPRPTETKVVDLRALAGRKES